MIFFSSDHHFGHYNIIKYCNRPYKDVSHMNEDMIRRWNERVQPEDLLFYLGDFALDIRYVDSVLPRLSGKKHLILGNHDLAFKKYKYVSRYLQAGFQTISRKIEWEIEGKLITMNHFPFKGEGDNKDYIERFTDYRLSKHNGLHLVMGHVHDSYKIKDNMVNVGVDVWDYYPVSLEEILNL